MATVRIPLGSRKYPGLYALVDEADAPLALQHSWHPHKCRHIFYAMTDIRKPDGRKTVTQLHNLIMGASLIDHINGDGLDCRRSNMRHATPEQNSFNRNERGRGNCPYKGVHYNKRQGFQAYIGYRRKKIHLGTYDTAVEAAQAYDAAARKLFGEFARPNFKEQ